MTERAAATPAPGSGTRRVVWLPYADRDEAESALGPLPEDVQVDSWTGAEHTPDSIAEVEFAVLPYMSKDNLLDRLQQMSALQVLQLQSAGFEDVVDAVPDGVTLCNGGGIHDTSTAELALALALSSGRRLDRFARQQSESRWEPTWGSSLADQSVGILGYGRIGQAIEARLAGFEVASITRFARSARTDPDVVPVAQLADRLGGITVLFVILPLTEQTTGLLDAAMLARLPDGALVVNVGRGKLVDTDALLAETSSGRLRAALDVVDPEPLPADHPLWSVRDVVISPHVGGFSGAFEPRRNRLVGAQLRRFLAGDPLQNVVG